MMQFPAVTALYAAILGLIYFAISLWVVVGRAQHGVSHGDGGVSGLNRRIRAHANFAEYVPLILVQVALLEGGGAGVATIHALLLPLTIVRVSHPIGMVAREKSVQQFVFRGAAAIATWLILLAAALLLLLRLA